MRNKVKPSLTAVLCFAAVFIFTGHAVFGCSRVGPFKFEELLAADSVAVATATEYVGKPQIEMWTTGVPDTEVRFRIDELVGGDKLPGEIVLKGYLSESDDFNDQESPYAFVRVNGRHGSCFANTYRTGGRFLLFLKKTPTGYTTNISALGPSNEQLRDGKDPWLQWVREEIARRSWPQKAKSKS